MDLYEVHVWSVDLDDPAWPADKLYDWLDAAERERAGRLRSEELRRRFAVRRGALRSLLSAYLGLAPGALRFRTRAHGKPELDAEDNTTRLHFNVSDCGPLALYALTRAGPLGVDVEALAPIPDMERLARRWFSAAEREALARPSPELRTRGFYFAWTRKEALVKAEGTGITLPLDRFSVSLTPGEEARLIGTSLPQLRAFDLYDVPLEPPYVAAVAVKRDGR
jgi:4'-phosphopantetheinyl transferase